jgi:hypothetical protein
MAERLATAIRPVPVLNEGSEDASRSFVDRIGFLIRSPPVSVAIGIDRRPVSIFRNRVRHRHRHHLREGEVRCSERSHVAVKASVIAVCIGFVAACSSSGGGGVSQSALEGKLKKEPTIQQLLQQGGKKANLTTKLVDCVATALEKNADPSDLQKYVKGQMNLDDIGGKAKGSANSAKSELTTCAKNVAQSATSSPAG